MNNKPKSGVFIFRYDPHSSFEGMFEEFWAAVDGKVQRVEPHIVHSNSIEALSTNMTKNRLRLFAALVEKKPANLTELACLLQKDYMSVRRDVQILEAMGLIRLEKIIKKAQGNQENNIEKEEFKPVALYQRIVFDFPLLTSREKNSKNVIIPNQVI